MAAKRRESREKECLSELPPLFFTLRLPRLFAAFALRCEEDGRKKAQKSQTKCKTESCHVMLLSVFLLRFLCLFAAIPSAPR